MAFRHTAQLQRRLKAHSCHPSFQFQALQPPRLHPKPQAPQWLTFHTAAIMTRTRSLTSGLKASEQRTRSLATKVRLAGEWEQLKI
jgi:hypothetical protein